MKTAVAVLAVVAALVVAAPVWADSTHTCQGNSCNGDTGTGTGGNATATATATGGAGGAGGSANVNNFNTNVNAPSFKQSQSQGQGQVQSQHQKQNQAQGQVQGQNNDQNIAPSQSVKVEGTSFDRYAPSVGGPALTAAGTGVCLGSVSIGLSGPMAGASFGITKVDKGCELRSNAALLYQMGYKDAAVRLLMKNDDVKDAMSAESARFGASVEKPAASVQPEREPVSYLAPQQREALQGGS